MQYKILNKIYVCAEWIYQKMNNAAGSARWQFGPERPVVIVTPLAPPGSAMRWSLKIHCRGRVSRPLQYPRSFSARTNRVTPNGVTIISGLSVSNCPPGLPAKNLYRLSSFCHEFQLGTNSIFISKKAKFLFTFTWCYVRMYLVKIGNYPNFPRKNWVFLVYFWIILTIFNFFLVLTDCNVKTFPAV